MATAWFSLALLIVFAPLSCSRTDPTSAKAIDFAGPAGAARSPLQVVRDAHASRLSHRTDLLAECVVPDQREAVVELVRSVDDLVAADERLHAALAEGYGRGVAVTFQRPGVANIIGVFSRDVDVIEERIRGDQAEVSVQIAGRVPLDYVEVVRQNGRWLMRTDPPIPGLAKELSNLGGVLSSLSREIFHFHYSLERFETEYRLRTMGVLKRIKALTS